MKRIICMLVVLAAVATAAQAWTMETDLFSGGWNAVWNSPMAWDVWDDEAATGTVNSWWSGPMSPGVGVGVQTMKWEVRPVVAPGGKGGTNRYANQPAADASKWGTIFVDPAINGRASNVAVIASYFSKDQLLMEHDWGYQKYQPDVYAWENKPYFKTDARISAVNGEGAFLRVKTYAYAPGGAWDGEFNKTLISYTDIALGADNVWQDIHRNAVAKPTSTMAPGVVTALDWLLFEMELINAADDTIVYIDEIKFVSDVDGGTSYGQPDWVLPEPATMSILALGGLLLRRKK